MILLNLFMKFYLWLIFVKIVLFAEDSVLKFMLWFDWLGLLISAIVWAVQRNLTIVIAEIDI